MFPQANVLFGSCDHKIQNSTIAYYPNGLVPIHADPSLGNTKLYPAKFIGLVIKPQSLAEKKPKGCYLKWPQGNFESSISPSLHQVDRFQIILQKVGFPHFLHE